MIATVNHHVTVRARSVLKHARLLIDIPGGPGRDGQELARVKHVGMATLAKHWFLHNEQGFMRGAVGIVAVEATFANRRVLPKKGTAFFAVTFVALVIDRIGRNEPLGLSTMRIVAIGAEHLLFAQRVVRGLHQRCPNLLVTSGAELLLARLS